MENVVSFNAEDIISDAAEQLSSITLKMLSQNAQLNLSEAIVAAQRYWNRAARFSRGAYHKAFEIAKERIIQVVYGVKSAQDVPFDAEKRISDAADELAGYTFEILVKNFMSSFNEAIHEARKYWRLAVNFSKTAYIKAFKQAEEKAVKRCHLELNEKREQEISKTIQSNERVK